MKKKNKVCHIVRGIPGSGKSTFAKTLGCRVFETDNFFINSEGQYVFDIKKIAEAHQTTLKDFMEFLKTGEEVCIANTAIHKWEYTPYFLVAELAGYEVKVHDIVPKSLKQLKEICDRNTHGVSASVVLQMWYEFEPYES